MANQTKTTRNTTKTETKNTNGNTTRNAAGSNTRNSTKKVTGCSNCATKAEKTGRSTQNKG